MKDKKKSIKNAIEVLEAIGHERESEGIKWTQYFMDMWDKKQWKENQLKKEKLKRKRKFSKREYFMALAGMLNEEIPDLDLTAGYSAMAYFNEKGVVLTLTTPIGEKYNRAFVPDGTPDVDFQAVVSFLVSLLDTVDKIENTRMKATLSKSGILLA